MKAPVSGAGDNKKIGNFVAVDDSDIGAIQFHPNAMAKKFLIELHRNDQHIKLNNYGRLNASIEGFIHSHISDSTRGLIFGSNPTDSAMLTGLKTSTFKKGNSQYDNYANKFFTGLPIETSFLPLLTSPFSSELDETDRGLKSSVLPYFENKSTSFKIYLEKDNCVFHQISKKNSFVYKLELIELRLLLYKIRFSQTIGYELNTTKLFPSCTKNKIQLPNIVTQTFIQQCSSGADWVHRTWSNLRPPSKLLIFKCDPLLISGGKKTDYSDHNSDKWHKMFCSNINVSFNNLVIKIALDKVTLK